MNDSKIEYVLVEDDAQTKKTAQLADVIWHDCYSHILKPAQIDYMVANIQSAAAIHEQIKNQGYEYYLIRLNDEDVGYIGVQHKDGKLLLSKLYILNGHRGHGIGQRSLDFVEELARKKQCAGVWLTVNRHNEKAISVYRKTGYEKTREQVEDIGGGYVMDDYIFEKPL